MAVLFSQFDVIFLIYSSFKLLRIFPDRGNIYATVQNQAT